MIAGRRVGPIAYVMNVLAQRFGELGEETALKATMDLIKFTGRQGESIDALLSRFDDAVSRAADDGMLQLTPSHTAAMIL